MFDDILSTDYNEIPDREGIVFNKHNNKVIYYDTINGVCGVMTENGIIEVEDI